MNGLIMQMVNDTNIIPSRGALVELARRSLEEWRRTDDLDVRRQLWNDHIDFSRMVAMCDVRIRRMRTAR